MKPRALALTCGIVSLCLLAGLLGYQLGRERSVDKADSAGSSAASQGDVLPPSNPRSFETKASARTGEPAGGGAFEKRAAAAWSHSSTTKRFYELERLFEELSAREAPEVMARILAWPDLRQRRGMLRPFFQRWGELEGPVALAAAEQMVGRARIEALIATYSGWARSDPAEAWRQAESHLKSAPPHAALPIIHGAVGELATSDLDAALTALAENRDQMRAGAYSFAIVEAAFETGQVEALVAKASALSDPRPRASLIKQAFTRWGETDTEEPLKAMAAIADADAAVAAMEGFLQGWSQEDPYGAVSYALDHAGDSLLAKSLGPILNQAMMGGSKEDNLRLLEKAQQVGVFDQYAPQIINGLSFADPALALQVVDSMEDERRSASYRHNALNQLANADFEAAKDYFKKLSDGVAKAQLIPSLAWSLSQQSAAGASLRELVDQIPAGEERARAMERLLDQAESSHSWATAEYLDTLATLAAKEPDLSERARALLDKLPRRPR